MKQLPLDIVFNPLAESFEASPKIVRSIVTYGELETMAEDQPDNQYLRDALKRRKKIMSRPGAYGIEDANKYGYFLLSKTLCFPNAFLKYIYT